MATPTPVSGFFGSADLVIDTDTLLYTVPADITSTVEISLCNRGTTTAKIRVAIGSGSSPANTDYREYDWPLSPNYPYSRTFVMGEGEKAWVRSNVATVSAQCSGFEELA